MKKCLTLYCLHELWKFVKREIKKKDRKKYEKCPICVSRIKLFKLQIVVAKKLPRFQDM